MHFLSYVIFDQQSKITFRKFSAPPPPEKKFTPPFLLTPPLLRIQKVQVPPRFANIENLSGPHCRKEGGHCVAFEVF